MPILIRSVRGMGALSGLRDPETVHFPYPAALNAFLEPGQQRRVVSPPTIHLFGSRVSRWGIGLCDWLSVGHPEPRNRFLVLRFTALEAGGAQAKTLPRADAAAKR